MSWHNYNGWDALASCSWALAFLGFAIALTYLIYKVNK